MPRTGAEPQPLLYSLLLSFSAAAFLPSAFAFSLIWLRRKWNRYLILTMGRVHVQKEPASLGYNKGKVPLPFPPPRERYSSSPRGAASGSMGIEKSEDLAEARRRRRRRGWNSKLEETWTWGEGGSGVFIRQRRESAAFPGGFRRRE